jgi:hypothetical protein
VADILNMSSGLRIKAPQDPDYDPAGTYPDHVYLYTGTVNSFHYAATRPQQWPPGTVGRYHNTDPVLINYRLVLMCMIAGSGLNPIAMDGKRESPRHQAKPSGGPKGRCFVRDSFSAPHFRRLQPTRPNGPGSRVNPIGPF